MHRSPAFAPILSSLGMPERAKDLQSGEHLFRLGDPVRNFYVVDAGVLVMLRTLPAGEVACVGKSGAGETFAEASLFSEAYHCDGVSQQRSRVLAYPKAEILANLTGPLGRLLAHHLAAQVQVLRSRLELMSVHKAEDRILGFLALRAEDGKSDIQINGTWKDVAGEIGLTHEALYRALSRMQRSGVISRTGRNVRITHRR